MADGIGVKARFRLHNCQNQRFIYAVFLRRFAHHAEIFVRTFIQVVWHQVDRHAVDDLQPGAAAFQARLQQVISKFRRTTFPANRLPGVIHNLAIQERLFGDLHVVNIGIKIDGTRIVTHQQSGYDRLAQMGGGIGASNGFDGNRTVVKVDVATGQILVGIFYVVFWTRDQHFLYAPDIFDVMGKLPHQNIKTIRVLNKRLVIGIFFFART
ncbi:hypothetical protein D3C75_903640 [compost metagenome]